MSREDVRLDGEDIVSGIRLVGKMLSSLGRISGRWGRMSGMLGSMSGWCKQDTPRCILKITATQ